MRHRVVASFGVLAAASAAFTLATHVAGQAPTPTIKPAPAAGKKYVVPRTPDGQPDLQGSWTNSTYVPLEPCKRDCGAVPPR